MSENGPTAGRHSDPAAPAEPARPRPGEAAQANADDPAHNAEEDAVWSAIIANRQMFNLFVTRIAHEVEEGLQRRQVRAVQRLGIGIAIFATLFTAAVAGFFGILFDFNDLRVTTAAQTAVAKEFQTKFDSIQSSLSDELTKIKEAQTANQIALSEKLDSIDNERTLAAESFRNEVLFLQLLSFATSLEIRESFSPDETETVFQLLKKISQIEILRERDLFPSLLEKVLDAFAAIGLDNKLDRLDELFRPRILDSPGMLLIMVQYYGRRIIGTPGAPDDWDEIDVRRIETYIDAAKNKNYPELALPFEMIIGFQRSGGNRNKIGKELFRDVNKLDEQERSTFLDLLVGLSDLSALGVTSTAQHERIAERASAFIKVYREELDAITDRVN